MENFVNKIFGPASLGPAAAYYNFEEKYIFDLDLQEEDLKKKILDIGGGDGNFASQVGDNVVNLDIDAHNYLQHTSMSVTAKAEQLPLLDETFEMVISTQSMPFFYGLGLRDKKEIEERAKSSDDPYSRAWTKEALKDTVESVQEKTKNFIDEVLRVLKKGGKAKFAPVPFVSGEWEAQYFEILKNILKDKQKEGGLDYEFVLIPQYKHVPNELEIYRLEIIKK